MKQHAIYNPYYNLYAPILILCSLCIVMARV